MGWTMFRERSGSEDKQRFQEAAMMAKRGLEMMCALAEEMEQRYSERGNGGMMGYRNPSDGMMGGYHNLGGEYAERGYYERMRDSRGRYM